MTKTRSNVSSHRIVGLIPAGGKSERLAPLPLSKELFPIGFGRIGKDRRLRPKVVCHYLLEKMRNAGVDKAFIVLRRGKWDIPAYLGDGELIGMHLAYLMMSRPDGVPYTLDQAFPFLHGTMVAFGFPDILFQPEDAYRALLDRQSITDAPIVLGLFPASETTQVDMVEVDATGRVHNIRIKPSETDLRYTWAIAVWTPEFTRFMHHFLIDFDNGQKQSDANQRFPADQELIVGDIIQAAIEKEMRVESVIFPDQICLDIGTPNNLSKAYEILR